MGMYTVMVMWSGGETHSVEASSPEEAEKKVMDGLGDYPQDADFKRGVEITDVYLEKEVA